MGKTYVRSADIVDGPGSELDADKLDGKDSSEFALANHTHTNMDADTLDGKHAAEFSQASGAMMKYRLRRGM